MSGVSISGHLRANLSTAEKYQKDETAYSITSAERRRGDRIRNLATQNNLTADGGSGSFLAAKPLGWRRQVFPSNRPSRAADRHLGCGATDIEKALILLTRAVTLTVLSTMADLIFSLGRLIMKRNMPAYRSSMSRRTMLAAAVSYPAGIS
jgi:hypothetical protein